MLMLEEVLPPVGSKVSLSNPVRAGGIRYFVTITLIFPVLPTT